MKNVLEKMDEAILIFKNKKRRISPELFADRDKPSPNTKFHAASYGIAANHVLHPIGQ